MVLEAGKSKGVAVWAPFAILMCSAWWEVKGSEHEQKRKQEDQIHLKTTLGGEDGSLLMGSAQAEFPGETEVRSVSPTLRHEAGGWFQRWG